VIVRLPPTIDARLIRLARLTGRKRSRLVMRAIAEFLEEQDDYLIAISRLKAKRPPVPLGDVMKRQRARRSPS